MIVIFNVSKVLSALKGCFNASNVTWFCRYGRGLNQSA